MESAVRVECKVFTQDMRLDRVISVISNILNSGVSEILLGIPFKIIETILCKLFKRKLTNDLVCDEGADDADYNTKKRSVS